MKSFIKAFIATFIITATLLLIYMFLAVNKAGVPGEDGIIAFLEDKGLLYDVDDKPVTKSTPTTEATTEEVTTEEPTTEEPVDIYASLDFNPKATSKTKPSNLIKDCQIYVNNKLTSADDFKPWYDMNFTGGEYYTDTEGIVTFRGNNFRDNPTYGVADISEGKFSEQWRNNTGSLPWGDEAWSGSGWTGQPLVMKWDDEVKKHSNMYDWAKKADNLKEVVYACMDGYVYFMDLETGKATRDSINLGFTFKGAGALDPRGYPILYVGAGYQGAKGPARVFIVNLLDGSVMHTFGNDDPIGMRGSLSYFDSSPLVDAASDTLIYPGENGVLYFIKLNTKYNAKKGKLSINPKKSIKWRYTGVRSTTAKYWQGMETSACMFRNYLFITDNGANLICLDVNTLKPVWVQDILDDSNSTPVLSVENGKLYLYVSTSFHLGWRSNDTATIPIWKIDAETGEIIWHTDYTCSSVEGVSGGVQSTIALGKNGLDDNIYVTVSRTHGGGSGVLACIGKKKGKVKWEHTSAYAWSSPVCFYNSDGTGYVLYGTSGGDIYMFDGKSGKLLDSKATEGGTIEASPIVYDDMMVIGTRGCRIIGYQLK